MAEVVMVFSMVMIQIIMLTLHQPLLGQHQNLSIKMRWKSLCQIGWFKLKMMNLQNYPGQQYLDTWIISQIVIRCNNW